MTDRRMAVVNLLERDQLVLMRLCVQAVHHGGWLEFAEPDCSTAGYCVSVPQRVFLWHDVFRRAKPRLVLIDKHVAGYRSLLERMLRIFWILVPLVLAGFTVACICERTEVTTTTARASSEVAASTTAEPSPRAPSSSREAGDSPLAGALRALNQWSARNDTSLLDQQWTDEAISAALFSDGSLDANRLSVVRTWTVLIYARRGRVFRAPWWREFAEQFPWYKAKPDYSKASLTAVDRANLKLLRRYELRLDPCSKAWPADPASQVSRDVFPGCPFGARVSSSTDDEEVFTLHCVEGSGTGVRPHGPSWRWFPTGRLATQKTFSHGLEDGLSLAW